MKELKKYKSDYPIYGEWKSNGAIAIDLENLWEVSKNEDEFIVNYSNVFCHEVLHFVIDYHIMLWREDKEEDIVDRISGTFTLPSGGEDLPTNNLCHVFKDKLFEDRLDE